MCPKPYCTRSIAPIAHATIRDSNKMFPLHIKSLVFAPRLIPTLAALVAMTLTLYLGQWQQGRAAEKRNLQADYDARASMQPLSLLSATEISSKDDFRKATALGRFDAAGQIFIDNKSEGNIVGFHVITPLRILNGDRYLMVNRGFVARTSVYPAPPVVSVPDDDIRITGMLLNANAKFLELGKAENNAAISGNVWQNFTVDRYRAQTNRDVMPLVLLANPTQLGLKALSERPDARVAKHTEYMLTWYSLALTVLILWLVLNTHRHTSSSLVNKA